MAAARTSASARGRGLRGGASWGGGRILLLQGTRPFTVPLPQQMNLTLLGRMVLSFPFRSMHMPWHTCNIRLHQSLTPLPSSAPLELFRSPLLLFFFFFSPQSHYVALFDLELTKIRQHSTSTDDKSINHHAWSNLFLNPTIDLIHSQSRPTALASVEIKAVQSPSPSQLGIMNSDPELPPFRSLCPATLRLDLPVNK